MCGIFFHLKFGDSSLQNKFFEENVFPSVQRRGPDDFNSYTASITNEHGTVLTLSFFGSVLHLRGDLTKQPQTNDNGDVLLWNGEIFGGIQVTPEENDTYILFKRLTELSHIEEDKESRILEIFSSIEGPWACVYFDIKTKNLWFGRDYLGRRSLMKTTKADSIVVTSVACKEILDQDFTEIPAKFLYSVNLNSLLDISTIDESIKSYVLKPPLMLHCDKMNVIHRCSKKEFNSLEEDGINSCGDKSTDDSTNDSRCRRSNTEKNEECLDKIDRDSYDEFFIKDDHSCGDKNPNRIPDQCYNCENKETENISNKVDNQVSCIKNDGDDNPKCTLQQKILTLQSVRSIFLNILTESVRSRVTNIPTKNSNGSNVGILFSGGIDSVVLAVLADRCLPEDDTVDLINVAFEQKYKIPQNVKKKHIKSQTTGSKSFDVPDRLTGRSAITELNPKRKWNFIEVDVTLEELQMERKSRISNLVYPLTTVLDDSIGCAIWFAARGIGKLYKLTEGDLELIEENYTSPVKVLLTGMGADEQLGGYARHRTKYESQGWRGLQEEMEMEINRISSRNLGRDDRCISDHGREARFPFLDENVVCFLKGLPVCVKCDPRLPRGVGEKILLREISAKYLGLNATSRFPKRAIQFGSRIAKLESSKEKGSESCDRLK